MQKALRYLSVFALVLMPIFAHGQSMVDETVYSFGSGETAFVLQQNAIKGMSYDATIVMSDTDEVWTLDKSQGTRGSVVYRNDAGRVFLRVNHIGGATVYPTPNSMGIPVLRKSKYRIEAQSPNLDQVDEELVSIEDWSRAYAYSGNKIVQSSEKV